MTEELSKVAIVTGGANGIGRATVLRLLEDGFCVVVADVDMLGAEDLLREVEASGKSARVRFFPCDVAQESHVQHLVGFALQEFGRLDAMVNNAGTGGSLTPLVDTSVADWDRTQAILLRGVFLGTKYAARAMIEQGDGGAIVNVASLAGMRSGLAGSAYCAAKGAVLSLTRSSAGQLAAHHIRANAVAPGPILTRMCSRDGSEQHFADILPEIQPWPEPGRPEDVAPVIAFLCGPGSRFVTGETIVVDGGLNAVGIDAFREGHPLGEAILDSVNADRLATFDYGAERSGAPSDLECLKPLNKQMNQPRRTIHVTDVGNSLGRALATAFIAAGHTVVGTAGDEEHLDGFRQITPPHRFDLVELAEDDAVGQWVALLSEAGQVPDLVVNTLGTPARPSQLWRLTSEEVQSVLRENLLGITNLFRHLVPAMLRQKRGTIVSLGMPSVEDSAPRGALLLASQWACAGLVRSLAEELPPGMCAVTLAAGHVDDGTQPHNDTRRAVGVDHWARLAVPTLLALTPDDNGRTIGLPGMGHARLVDPAPTVSNNH